MEVWSLSSRIKVLYLKIWRKCVVTVTDSAFEGSFTGGGGGDLNKSVFKSSKVWYYWNEVEAEIA